MMKLLTTREALKKLFDQMTYLYDEKRFPDFVAVYQFILEEEGVTYEYYLSVADNKAQYAEGKHDSPSLTVYAPVAVWFDIAGGRLNGFWGWLTKKYRIEGPMSYLRKLNGVFGKQLSIREIPKIDETTHDYELPQKRIWKKPDKVLVLHGSPRKESGATYFYLLNLIKGIEKSGVDVELIHIYDKEIKIESCKGCFSCWKTTNGQCIIEDDVRTLKEKFEDAYLTIFALPLYADSRPSKVQAFIERMFVCYPRVFTSYDKLTRHPLRDSRERYIALFAINGFPEIEHLNPLVDTFKANARNLNRPLVATILRPGAESYILTPYHRESLKQILSALEKAGHELVERGSVSKNILNEISDNYGIDYNDWRKSSNLFWYLKVTQEIEDNNGESLNPVTENHH